MLTDKTLKVLLKEDIQQYPKMKELYDLLLNTTDEEKKSASQGCCCWRHRAC